MLEDLDQMPWEDLYHAYGAATDFPLLILGLLSEFEEERNATLFQMDMAYCHQGSVFSATPHVIPFLFELLRAPFVKGKPEILSQIATFYQGNVNIDEFGKDDVFVDYGALTRLAIEKHLSDMQALLQEDDEALQTAVLMTLGLMQGSLDTVESLLKQMLQKHPQGAFRKFIWLSALQMVLSSEKPLPALAADARQDALQEDADQAQRYAAAMLAIACGEEHPAVWQVLIEHADIFEALQEHWQGVDGLREMFHPQLDRNREFKFQWGRQMLLSGSHNMRRNGHNVLKSLVNGWGRMRAVRAAFQDRVVQALAEGLEAEDDWICRSFLMRDLEEHGAPTEVRVQEYLRWLNLKDAELAGEALHKLSGLRDERVLPYVQQFLYDNRKAWIDAAASAIADWKLPMSEHYPRMRSLVRGEVEMEVLPSRYSSDRTIKKTRMFTNIGCLQHFGEQARELLPEVLALCDTEWIYAAREVLQSWGMDPPELLAGLKKRLWSEDYWTYEYAKNWLFDWGYSADEDVLQRFRALAFHEKLHLRMEGAELLWEHAGETVRLIEVCQQVLHEYSLKEEFHDRLPSTAIRHLRNLECFDASMKALASSIFLKSPRKSYSNEDLLIEVCTWFPDRTLILEDVAFLMRNLNSLAALETLVEVLRGELLPLVPNLEGWVQSIKTRVAEDGYLDWQKYIPRIEQLIEKIKLAQP